MNLSKKFWTNIIKKDILRIILLENITCQETQLKNWFVLTNKGKNIFEDKRTVNSGRIPEKEASFEIKYNIVKKMEIFLKHQKEIRHS